MRAQQTLDRLNARKTAIAPQVQQVTQRHENNTAPRAISAFNLFQTPEPLAARMASISNIEPHHKVLEPSFGLGRLVKAILPFSEQITGIEIDERVFFEFFCLDFSGNYYRKDFLACDPSHYGLFDRVVMNPPFKQGLDIKHTMHALKFLEPDSILTGLCYDGVKQNRDLEPLCDLWEPLPKGTFEESNTKADVVLFQILT